MRREPVTGPFEAAAAKAAAPAVKESRKQLRRLQSRLKADHGPIGQCPNLNRNHSDRVVMLVGVAPSRSAKRVPTSQFVRCAQRVGETLLGNAATTDWSNKDEVRLIVRDSDNPMRTDQHRLHIYPSGFMLLQWGLKVSITTDAIGPLPMGEFIRVLRKVRAVVQSPIYRELHDQRIGERRRRLDWRVGLTQGVPTGSGTLYVSRFDTPRDSNFRRAVRHDLGCSPAGFAPQRLVGLKPAAPFEDMLQVIIEDMTANAGITDPQQATEMIMADHTSDWA